MGFDIIKSSAIWFYFKDEFFSSDNYLKDVEHSLSLRYKQFINLKDIGLEYRLSYKDHEYVIKDKDHEYVIKDPEKWMINKIRYGL